MSTLRERLGSGTARLVEAARSGRGVRVPQDRDALVAALERTRSRAARDLLVRLASRGQSDLASVTAALAQYRDTVPRAKAIAALKAVDSAGLRALARLTMIQSGSASETLDAVTLYRALVDREGLKKLPKEHQQLYDEALLAADDLPGARTVAREWTEPSELESRLIADTVNPFVPGRGVDTTAWLSLANAGFAGAGLETVSLAQSGAAAFDRLVCEAGERIEGGPLVTVVMTSYRPDHSLGTAVRSVLASSWSNLEVIIVDDASGADFSIAYAEVAALDDRIRIEELPVNSGTYAARNLALQLARGEFVTFHDSDDWMHPRRVQFQVEHLLANPDQPANASTSVRVTDSLRFSHRRALAPKLCEPSILLRREPVIEAVGYFDLVRKNGDTEYRSRIEAAFGRSTTVIGTDLAWTWQRLTSGSLSNDEVGRNWIHPSRRAYISCYARWHGRIRSGESTAIVTTGPARVTPCWAPPELRQAARQESASDVVFLADWLNGGDEPARAAHIALVREWLDAGRRVGLAHLESFDDLRGDRSLFGDSVVDLLNSGELELVQLDAVGIADLLVVLDPSVLSYAAAEPAALRPRRVDIVGGGVSLQDEVVGNRAIQERVVAIFGAPPTWVPTAPAPEGRARA